MVRKLLPLIAVALLAACANTPASNASASCMDMPCCKGKSCCTEGKCDCCGEGYCPLKAKP